MPQNLQDFKDSLAKMLFGMTAAEAHKLGICISCKKTPMFLGEIDEKEWQISGLCWKCFEEQTQENSE